MSACLTDSQVDGYADGSLNGLSRADLDAHVAACRPCQRAVRQRKDDAALFHELRGLHRNGAVHSDTHVDTPGDAPEPLRSSVPGYEILHELHRGGQGVVYKAIQKATRRPVALKLLLQSVHASQRQRQRFEREIDLVAGLRHPHIVTVYDCGIAAGQCYFAMEYIDGVPAHAKPQAAPRETLALFQRICAAVAYAHRHGVIHRDLKPANILIDAAGEPHVLDFGLAKLSQPEPKSEQDTLTASGEFVGTLAYAAPEQARGDVHQIDVRTDVYSLGVILYEMLTGAFPYPVDAPLTEVLHNILDATPTNPRRLRAELDGEVEAILHKALAKEPERRYQSAELMEQDLGRYLAGQAIDAKRDSAWYVLRKSLRRHRLGVGVAAAFVAVIVTGLVASLVFWRDAVFERDRARDAEGEEKLARTAEAEERKRAEFQAYVANLAAANTALQVFDVVDARERLERTPARLRSWEYAHLQLRLDQSVNTFKGHTSYVEAVAFSSDGKRLISCSWDKTARVVDVTTGELLALYQAEAELFCLAIHPKSGEVALGCWDGTVRLWDPETKRITRTLKGPRPQVWGLAFSPAGDRLAAVFSSKEEQESTIKLWDTASWEEVGSISEPIAAMTPAFAPTGDQLAVVTPQGVMLWNTRTSQAGQRLHVDGIRAGKVIYHPSKPWLLVVYGDGSLRLWDLEFGSVVRQMRGPQRMIHAVALSPDGLRAITGSRDKVIRLWDLESGEELGVLCGHTWTVSAVAFAPDGKSFASGGWDNQVKLWDLTQPEPLPVLRWHERTVTDLAFEPGSQRMASASWDGVVGIWNLKTGRLVGGLYGHQEAVQAVAYHPTERVLASASWDRTVRLWNTKTGKPLSVLRGHSDRVHCVAFSPDGKRLISGSRDNTLRVWDPTTGAELAVWQKHDDHVHTVAFSPDGSRVVSAGHKTLLVWDAASGACLTTFRRNIVQEDFSLAFHPNGRWLAAGSDFRTLTIWDIVEGKEVIALAGHSDEIRVVAFSPDGTRLASAAHDGTVRLWDVATWTPLFVLHGYKGRITSLAFTPDGTRLLGGLGNGGICIWDSRVRTKSEIRNSKSETSTKSNY